MTWGMTLLVSIGIMMMTTVLVIIFIELYFGG